MKDNYSDIKKIFDTLRRIDEDKIRHSLNESEDDESEDEDDDNDLSKKMDTKDGDSVPYSKNDEMMKNITETAKSQFGASFEGFKNPMLYYPDDGDVVLCGKVPSMNNLLFQFRYLDANGGCFIWTSPLTLTKDNMTKLNRIFGVYENWKKELSTSDDIKPVNYKKK